MRLAASHAANCPCLLSTAGGGDVDFLVMAEDAWARAKGMKEGGQSADSVHMVLDAAADERFSRMSGGGRRAAPRFLMSPLTAPSSLLPAGVLGFAGVRRELFLYRLGCLSAC